MSFFPLVDQLQIVVKRAAESGAGASVVEHQRSVTTG